MPKEDYTPNSHKYNESYNNEKKENEPALHRSKTKAREHTTVSQRFKDVFFAENFTSVAEYIVWDVIIPAVKDMVLCLVETTLFGRSDAGSYTRSNGHYSRTDYRRASSSARRDDDRHSVRTRPRNFSIERFEFESRREAEEVLSQMNEQCRKYDGVCPVSSFYDFIDCDRPADWTHDRWGWSWKALDRARIIRKSNGWYSLSITEPDTYID